MHILDLEVEGELLPENILAEQILHPYAAAAYLVHVARTYAALSGPDLSSAPAKALFHTVNYLVIRHHYMCCPAYDQAGAVTPPLLELTEFVQKLLRIDHYSVSYHTRLAGVKHPRRKQMKNVLLSFYNNGMPCVGAALVSDNDIDTGSQ